MQIEQNGDNQKSMIKIKTQKNNDQHIHDDVQKMQLEQGNNNNAKSNHKKKNKNKKQSIQSLSLNITSQQYTNLDIKLLGNHSLWKKTTFQTRYNDHRLRYINLDYFINKKILNIGCNQAFIDIQIAMRFFPSLIYGIDIDKKIIKNAQKTISTIVGKNKRYQEVIEKSNDQGKMKQEQKKAICNKIQELPLFFQDRVKEKFSLQSYLPSNVVVETQNMFKPQKEFPLNIKLQAQNIFTFQTQEKFDTILCFKITKWIHLTYGDEGIRLLFKKIYQILKPEGVFILQAQDWQSYKKQKSQFNLYKQNYNTIKHGPNHFEVMLTGSGEKQFRFELISKIQNDKKNSTNSINKLAYPIYVFKKQNKQY